MAHNHGRRFPIDLYAFNSKLKYLNPDYKLIGSIVVLILTLVLNDVYVSLYIFLSMCFISVILGGIGFWDYISMLLTPLSFIILASLSIALNFSAEPGGDFYIHLGNLYIFSSVSQLIRLFKLIIKVLTCVSIMQALILSTMPYEIILSLKNMHLPKLIIELMNLVYRFIFILTEVHANMHDSALSRLGYRNLKASFMSFGNIASNILILALKKANAYYTAMEARCFNGELNFLQEDKILSARQMAGAGFYILSIFFIWIMHIKYIKGIGI